MKRSPIFAILAMTILTLGLAGIAGCGGGSGMQTPAASITSFAATPASITVANSASLSGVFANGTGVITPGNIPASSGVAVSVSPATTTTYTLTVTGTTGSPATATVTVTVNAAPTISSFVAQPATITAGQSTNLTGTFAGGTGVITPGNLPATSGTAVSVSPTTTTTYTLTVTNSSNTAITSTVTVTVNPPPPSITSFVASQTTITAGQSTELTGNFIGGTAVITPGSLTAMSGNPVAVSPATTTTYTLTLTPTGGGNPLTSMVTITVNPAPTITSFVAAPATISAGASSTLTGVFANGTGVITGAPSALDVTSGAGVSVTPTASTTYTLTVTPPAGGPAVTATATVTVTGATSTVTVNLSTKGPATTDQILGMNLAAWFDVAGTDNAPLIESAFQSAGIKAVRWPGGSWGDAYNWETNDECPNNDANTNDTFSNFVNNLVVPTGLDVALIADYGTGKNCTGPGDPTEAAAWAAEATTLGITVSHMTVGNEEYGSWETDNHTVKNDPTTYAAATAGTNGYYALIKAASPNTLVGVSVNPGNSPAWDPIVLAGAPYDFVEYHSYPEAPGSESDTFIVQQAAQDLTNNIDTIRTELATAGHPDTPIYVGEIGGPYSNPGKQSWSITQGLYAGQVLGEMMNDGISRLTWWIGFGNCNGTAGNDSTSLYGWQDFGAYNVFSDGTQDPTCPGAGAFGTMSPTARAFQLFSNVAVNGENALTATVAGDTTDVRAYAATNNGGTALVLFNDNETTAQSIQVTLTGQASSTGVTVMTYDKAIYDLSGSPTGTPADPAGTSTWAPPTTTNLGAQTLPMTLTLTPWSMNVVIIK
jgi:hypothetical protein